MTKIKKRYLITKGKLPVSAGGGKSNIKDNFVFFIIIAILIIILILIIY